MKIKAYELKVVALDWAVTSIEDPDALRYGVADWLGARRHNVKHGEYVHRYHQSWMQGGPIIERESIEICRLNNGEWRGQKYVQELDKMFRNYGPTPLIAAMRCYVAATLGDEVEVPEELA